MRLKKWKINRSEKLGVNRIFLHLHGIIRNLSKEEAG